MKDKAHVADRPRSPGRNRQTALNVNEGPESLGSRSASGSLCDGVTLPARRASGIRGLPGR